MSNASNRRQAQRLPVVMPGCYRTADGIRGAASIVDLSVDGCMAADLRGGWSAGDVVFIRLDQLEVRRAKVRCNRAGRAGVAFDRPLYLPVVEHLGRLWRAPPADETADPADPGG